MKKLFSARIGLFAGIIIFLSLGVSLLLYAYGNGVSGVTLKSTTTGCYCHSTTPSTSVTVAITGPDTVLAGQTVHDTVTISRSSNWSKGGTDIACNRGTLGVVSAGTKLSNGEIVHSSSFNPGATSYKVVFNYTAPATSGPETIYANGAAGTSSPPSWNWAPNKTVYIKAATKIIKTDNIVPSSYSLQQNYPNPFNPTTSIRFSVPKSGFATLKIYGSDGREISSLLNGYQEAGNFVYNFNATNLSSGIYYYRFESGSFSETRKMMLVK